MSALDLFKTNDPYYNQSFRQTDLGKYGRRLPEVERGAAIPGCNRGRAGDIQRHVKLGEFSVVVSPQLLSKGPAFGAASSHSTPHAGVGSRMPTLEHNKGLKRPTFIVGCYQCASVRD